MAVGVRTNSKNYAIKISPSIVGAVEVDIMFWKPSVGILDSVPPGRFPGHCTYLFSEVYGLIMSGFAGVGGVSTGTTVFTQGARMWGDGFVWWFVRGFMMWMVLMDSR